MSWGVNDTDQSGYLKLNGDIAESSDSSGWGFYLMLIDPSECDLEMFDLFEIEDEGMDAEMNDALLDQNHGAVVAGYIGKC